MHERARSLSVDQRQACTDCCFPLLLLSLIIFDFYLHHLPFFFLMFIWNSSASSPSKRSVNRSNCPTLSKGRNNSTNVQSNCLPRYSPLACTSPCLLLGWSWNAMRGIFSVHDSDYLEMTVLLVLLFVLRLLFVCLLACLFISTLQQLMLTKIQFSVRPNSETGTLKPIQLTHIRIRIVS